MAHAPSDSTVEQLNSFLRGEISAVETYKQALGTIQDSSKRSILEKCLTSHQDRVAKLRQRIQTMGGTPADSSGPWGVFAKAVQGGANVIGEEPAVSALEEGEDHGMNDYRGDLSSLDEASRRFVQSELLPEQQRTHAALSALKHGRSPARA